MADSEKQVMPEMQIREDERSRVLAELRAWLGSDSEYDALGAIWESLRANPQLVPEHEVPLRFLKALRNAVNRFAAHSNALSDSGTGGSDE